LSRSVPAGGAKSLTLKGKVVVLCSPRTREAVQKDVALLKGTQIELGPIKAEITDVRGEEQGKRLYVDFTNDTGPEVLKELRFEDAQGKEIKSRQFDSSSAESGGKTILDVKFYDLAGNPDKVTVKAVYYEKIEKFEVPVDLTVSLGL
jgi:hypothetical protein